MTHEPLRILVLCTGNSCRSQMAEGWLRHLGGPQVQAFSAGVRPIGINPKAMTVMQEAGVDISGQSSDDLRDYLDQDFELIITVCGNAKEACPVFPGAKHTVHMPYLDPYYAEGSVEEQLQVFRRVRDQIREGMAAVLKERNALA